MSKLDYKELAQSLGLKFADISSLRAAFIHRSYLNESREEESNERLEFLGDAVLEICTTEFLYLKFPEKPEGELTAIRSALVRKENLAAAARILQLGSYLLLSRGENASGGRSKDYLLANTMEALIGAIYLESGLKVAQNFITKYILPSIDGIIVQKLYIDGKSYFQELAQARVNITPTYELLKSIGPDHAKIFTIGAFLGKELVGQGEGGSKQIAEEAAARNAISKLKWD